MSGRGTDVRLEQTDRVAADERKAARKARRDSSGEQSRWPSRELVHREAVRSARSVVVKIGTTALTTSSGMFDASRLQHLADAIEARMKAGSDVVIVSSGAIAAGIEPLGLSRRPTDLATKQAAAASGRSLWSNSWNAAFGHYGRTMGQVLLTAHDISIRVQHTECPTHPGPAARAARGGDRQRERHRGDQRDQIR